MYTALLDTNRPEKSTCQLGNNEKVRLLFKNSSVSWFLRFIDLFEGHNYREKGGCKDVPFTPRMDCKDQGWARLNKSLEFHPGLQQQGPTLVGCLSTLLCASAGIQIGSGAVKTWTGAHIGCWCFRLCFKTYWAIVLVLVRLFKMKGKCILLIKEMQDVGGFTPSPIIVEIILIKAALVL